MENKSSLDANRKLKNYINEKGRNIDVKHLAADSAEKRFHHVEGGIKIIMSQFIECQFLKL